MHKDIINTIFLASCFLVLFAIAEFLYHKLKIRAEFTRKFVHLGTGLLSLLFPILLASHWLVLFLCVSFGLILIVSLKYNFLKSINAIDRDSVGSLAYPVSVYLCYLAYDFHGHNYIFFYLPILVLAICDPLAALAGKKWPLGKYRVGTEYKTIMGSSFFFLSAFIICITLISLNSKDGLSFSLHHSIAAISISTIATLAEAVSRRGYDNLTIPASVVFALILNNYIL